MNKREYEILEEICNQRLSEIYGGDLPYKVKKRLELELKHIERNRFATNYLISKEFVAKAKRDGYPALARGCCAGSLVAYLAGITDIDPMQYNIPAELFMGDDGDKIPYFELSVAEEYERRAKSHLKRILARNECREIQGEIAIVPHYGLSMLHLLNKLTGKEMRYGDDYEYEVIRLFMNEDTEIDERHYGTLGIPEFDSKREINMVKEISPRDIDDIIKIVCLAHGTDTWEPNARMLLDYGIARFEDIITSRDDIYQLLITKGIDGHTAYEIMECVRKGQARPEIFAKWNYYKEIMHEHGIPNWYTDSCEHISYLFPKGHCVGVTLMALSVALYKIYYPEEFYAAFALIYATNLRDVIMKADEGQCEELLRNLKGTEESELIHEMQHRHIDFEKVRRLITENIAGKGA